MKDFILKGFILPFLSFAQENHWELLDDKAISRIQITESGKYVIEEYIFEVSWNDSLSYSNNIGFYGGIEKLIISREESKIQCLKNIEDAIALGSINLSFFDYNMDGHLDFSLPLNDRWPKYYLYNPETQQFQHSPTWDYIKIQKINQTKNLIQTHPSGMQNNTEIYKVEGMKLLKRWN